jgi:hypothetical protein
VVALLSLVGLLQLRAIRRANEGGNSLDNKSGANGGLEIPTKSKDKRSWLTSKGSDSTVI